MSRDSLADVERVFREALDRRPEDRERFLYEKSAGNWGLYETVTALLSHHESHDMLDDAAPFADPLHLLVDLPSLTTGTVIESASTAYRLTERVGEGSMGVVYAADQLAPVRRRVALKVAKYGVTHRDAGDRFASEQRALALMNHPGVAHFYEAGRTKDGRLFFAMEYIDGLPVTKHCDRKRLTIDDRIAMFMDVCGAVQHAHQRGIIHRDLKPRNILVASAHRTSAPKVIDFGVAKAMDRHVVERAAMTQDGISVGSPEYMSPEQAAGRSIDIDTRADIYALGVLLHELLTGEVPIAQRESDGLGDMQRRIRDEEPPSLTERLRANADRARAAAAARATTSGALVRRLEGELEWIVAKALEKDRVRRYASASELAADLERHRRCEVVSVGPPSRRYRIGRVVARHRPVVLGAVAAALALVVAFGTSTWLFVESRRARLVAEAERDDVLRLADAARLDRVSRAADALYPPRPEKIAAMEAWLEGPARELAARLPDHEARLTEVGRALAAISANGDAAIVDAGAEFVHDVLSTLVARLRVFVDPDPRRGLIADVERRLVFARSVRHDSIESFAAEWRAAVASIRSVADCPMYRGLDIRPQLGIVPIGRDASSGLWEFVHVQSGARPVRGASGTIRPREEDGIVFVLLPGGTFRMGAREDAKAPSDGPTELGSRANERPVHEVALDPFFMSKYEVTQAQWVRIVGTNPSDIGPAHQLHGSLLQPVENVNWDDAFELSRRSGLVLPTEAQWEYAARADADVLEACEWADSCVARFANLIDRDAVRELTRYGMSVPVSSRRVDSFVGPAPVGSFLPNGFGLHDMIGNVWEWCRDHMGSYEVPVRPGDGLRLAEPTEPVARVCRGCGYRNRICRVARRGNFSPALKDEIGVRLARPIDGA